MDRESGLPPCAPRSGWSSRRLCKRPGSSAPQNQRGQELSGYTFLVVKELSQRLAVDPYSGKALVGNLKGYYSVRLGFKDRVVYSIHDDELVVLVLRVRTHYGE